MSVASDAGPGTRFPVVADLVAPCVGFPDTTIEPPQNRHPPRISFEGRESGGANTAFAVANELAYEC